TPGAADALFRAVHPQSLPRPHPRRFRRGDEPGVEHRRLPGLPARRAEGAGSAGTVNGRPSRRTGGAGAGGAASFLGGSGYVEGMTSLKLRSIAGRGAPASGAPWRVEIAETLKLAAPMAATQLGQIAMMTTDLALLGRLGDRVVAGAALAHTVLFAAYTLGMGLMAAVAPLASQAFGARKPRLVRRSVRVGLWAALLAGVPLTAVQMWGEELLLALGQPPEAAALAGRYLAGLAWCLVPSW